MNFHDRANSDIEVAKVLISKAGNPGGDVGIQDIAAYHVQQAVEKELKYILHDIYHIDDSTRRFRTHSLSDLISQVEERGLTVPEEIVNNSL